MRCVTRLKSSVADMVGLEGCEEEVCVSLRATDSESSAGLPWSHHQFAICPASPKLPFRSLLSGAISIFYRGIKKGSTTTLAGLQTWQKQGGEGGDRDREGNEKKESGWRESGEVCREMTS